MATNTPNLNLVLPVGTENVSRQIINDNNTKIDIAVGNNASAINTLNSKIASQAGTVTVAQNVTINEMVCQKAGNIVTLNGAVTLTGSFAGKDALLFTLPVGFRPSSLVEFFTYSTYNGTNGMFHFRVKTNGEVVTQVGAGNVTGVVFINLSFCI